MKATVDCRVPEREEERCRCNRLICVIREGKTVEIRCGRCKRLVEIHTLGIRKIECI